METKKKFKHTKIGKVITSPVGSNLVRLIPFGVGSFLGNVIEETKTSEPGQINKFTIFAETAKLLFYMYLVYLWFQGQITIDQVQDAQNIVNP